MKSSLDIAIGCMTISSGSDQPTVPPHWQAGSQGQTWRKAAVGVFFQPKVLQFTQAGKQSFPCFASLVVLHSWTEELRPGILVIFSFPTEAFCDTFGQKMENTRKTTKKRNVFCLGGLELRWPSRLSPSAILFVHVLPFSYCGVSQFWWADSDFVLLTGHYCYGKMKD